MRRLIHKVKLSVAYSVKKARSTCAKTIFASAFTWKSIMIAWATVKVDIFSNCNLYKQQQQQQPKKKHFFFPSFIDWLDRGSRGALWCAVSAAACFHLATVAIGVHSLDIEGELFHNSTVGFGRHFDHCVQRHVDVWQLLQWKIEVVGVYCAQDGLQN